MEDLIFITYVMPTDWIQCFKPTTMDGNILKTKFPA